MNAAAAVQQALEGPRLIEWRASIYQHEPCVLFGEASTVARWLCDCLVSFDGGEVVLLGGRGSVGDAELTELTQLLEHLPEEAGARVHTNTLALILHERVCS